MTAVRQASTFVVRPPMSARAEIRLTPRELEVLSLTAEGLTSKEIGRHLGISPRTADVHRTHLIHKLGLRNRVEAVHYAIRSGILAGPSPAVPDGEDARRTASLVETST
jgi:DNA-binding CsgD family transcriptional regulator